MQKNTLETKTAEERDKSMIKLPTTCGWSVTWYTGKTSPKTRKTKDGTRKVVGEIRWRDSFESASKEAVEAKAKQLEAQGFEIESITECIF